eukprot:COSAG06_NODE_72208_length_174_cov_16.613333_1_plen_21_part_10
MTVYKNDERLGPERRVLLGGG